MKKKLDYFNLFYSVGAVIILIGVIAKLLEWEVQDLFMTVGLTMEAIVFGASSIKYHYVSAGDNVQVDNLDGLILDKLGNANFGSGGNEGGTYVQGDLSNTAVVDINFKENQNTLAHKVDTIYDLAVEKQLGDILSSKDEIASDEVTNSVSTIAPSFKDEPPIDYLWQLDKMGLISISKEIFYQPEWLLFKDDEYEQLANVVKRVFDKNLLSKKDVKTLYNYAITIPVSTLSDLSVSNETQILTANEVELIYNAFKIYRFKGFFDYFIIEENNQAYLLRKFKSNEILIFGGESPLIIEHCKQFHKEIITISPNLPFLYNAIKIKDNLLVDWLIKHFTPENLSQFDSLTKAFFDQKDFIKMMIIQYFENIVYDLESDDKFELLKSLIVSILYLNDKKAGYTFLKNNLSFVNGEQVFNLKDIIHITESKLEYGPDKITFSLHQLFDPAYLNNIDSIISLINKLASENIYTKNELLEVFDLANETSKKDIFLNFKNYIIKNNITPSPTQLEFMSIHNKFSK